MVNKVSTKPASSSYQYLCATSDFHENAILVVAIIIDDSGVPNYEVEIIPGIDMNPNERLGSIRASVVRKLHNGNRYPIGILNLRGELRHDAN
jgi:hypothetical protein